MGLQYSIALVGDYDPSVPAHQAIPISLDLAATHYGAQISTKWVPTAQIQHVKDDLASYQGFWCVPASPYENTQGALEAIRFAREQQIPFLGTCGGFQHALIEYAQNVVGMVNAQHAETNPHAAQPLIAPLACSLVEVQAELFLEPETLLHKAYGTLKIREGYRCRYGLNPEHEKTLFTGSLRVSARDAEGEVRGAELQNHPFFVGTLFQPERRALQGELPPLVREFVSVIIQRQSLIAA